MSLEIARCVLPRRGCERGKGHRVDFQLGGGAHRATGLHLPPKDAG